MALEYSILLHPGHNRVYYEASRMLALKELEAVSACLAQPPQGAEIVQKGGLWYADFCCEGALPHADRQVLARLSFAFGLFAREGGALVPQAPPEHGLLDESLRTILRYTGKTNEQFTRLMINLAIAAGAFAKIAPLCVLDPLCGKGTTLFEAALMGHDACGIDIAGKQVAEGVTFFKKYLENARICHETQAERMRQPKGGMAESTVFRYAHTREALQTDPRTLRFIAGDAAQVKGLLKKESFHVLVADLPYGVQHASQTGGQGFTRNPHELLEKSLVGWRYALKPGGALALAWNRFLLSRAQMESLLDQFGFEVLQTPPFTGLAHRVDQAIDRDVAVARKSAT